MHIIVINGRFGEFGGDRGELDKQEKNSNKLIGDNRVKQVNVEHSIFLILHIPQHHHFHHFQRAQWA